MADLEHLAKEFEKVHDALPEMLVRTARLEQWVAAHPETHRLEGVVLSVAKAATDQRLESMNELRKQIDTERGTFITRELYDREHRRIQDDVNGLRTSRDENSGEKGFLEKFWPLFLAVGMFIVGHFWK